jgi:hypothetical protein
VLDGLATDAVTPPVMVADILVARFVPVTVIAPCDPKMPELELIDVTVGGTAVLV